MLSFDAVQLDSMSIAHPSYLVAPLPGQLLADAEKPASH